MYCWMEDGLWYLGMGVTLIDPAFKGTHYAMGASSNYPSHWAHIKIEGRLSHSDIASDNALIEVNRGWR